MVVDVVAASTVVVMEAAAEASAVVASELMVVNRDVLRALVLAPASVVVVATEPAGELVRHIGLGHKDKNKRKEIQQQKKSRFM